MNPLFGRMAFTSGITIFLMALLVMPALKPNTPSYIANVLALIISGGFTLAVVIMVRRAARLPFDPRKQDEDLYDRDDDTPDDLLRPPM